MGRKIAIIGTAGRDKNYPLSAKHWDFMCNMVSAELDADDHLISGGAAWADHVAIWAFRRGLVQPSMHACIMARSWDRVWACKVIRMPCLPRD